MLRPFSHSSRRAASARGATLVELMVSMAALSLLLGAMVSSIVIAGFALPSRDHPAAAAAATGDATERLCSELFAATAFTLRSATAVEFTVADRTGDAAPDTLRYAWNGTPGTELLRTLNGGTPVAVLTNVHDWRFDYLSQSLSKTTTTQTTATSETLWASFDGWTGITPTYLGHQLTTSSWGAVRFQLSLPAEATNIKVTRASFKIRGGASAGTLYASVHRPSGSGATATPASAAIGSAATFPTTSLDASYTWREFAFTDVNLASSDTDLFVVLKGSASGVGLMQYCYASAAPVNSTEFLWSTSSGGSWSPSSNRQQYDAPFMLYGRYTVTTQTTGTTTRYFIAGVRITGQLGSDAAGAIETSIHVANMPEVSTP